MDKKLNSATHENKQSVMGCDGSLRFSSDPGFSVRRQLRRMTYSYVVASDFHAGIGKFNRQIR